MTKRDFELIARTLLEVGADGALCMDSARDRVALAEQFALALKDSNPRFDAERFIRASTTEEDRKEIADESTCYASIATSGADEYCQNQTVHNTDYCEEHQNLTA